MASIASLTVDVRGLPRTRFLLAAGTFALLSGLGAFARSPQNAAAAVLAYVVWLGVRWAAPGAWMLLVNRRSRSQFWPTYRLARDVHGPSGRTRWRWAAGLFYAFREARDGA